MKSLRDGLLSAFSLIRTWSSGETEARVGGERLGELGTKLRLGPRHPPAPHHPPAMALGAGPQGRDWDAHRAHSQGCGSSSGWLRSGQWSRRWAQPGRHREPATPWPAGPGCGGGPPCRPGAERQGSARQWRGARGAGEGGCHATGPAHQDHVSGGDVHVGLDGLLAPGGRAAVGAGAGLRGVAELGRDAADPRGLCRRRWCLGAAKERLGSHVLAAQLLGDPINSPVPRPQRYHRAAPCTPSHVPHPMGSHIPRGPTWYSKVVSAAPSGPRAARRSFSRCLAWRLRQKAAAAAMAMPATQASAMKVSSTEWKPSLNRAGRE